MFSASTAKQDILLCIELSETLQLNGKFQEFTQIPRCAYIHKAR